MSRLTANTLLLIVAALWGVGNVAQKTALDHLGPFWILGLRSLIGLLVILPCVNAEVRASKTLGRGAWPAVALTSALFSLALTTQQVGYGITSVTNASFIVSTTVVFTPLFAWLFLGELPRRVTGLAVAMVLLGVLLMGEELAKVNGGDALCLASALLFSLWLVLLTGFSRGQERPFTMAAAQFGGAAALGVAVGLRFEPISVAALIQAAPELLVLGVFSTGVGFTLQVIAQRSTSPTEAAIVTSTESFFGAAAATALLGEAMTLSAGIGAVLILAATLLIQLPRFSLGSITGLCRAVGRT